MSKIKNKKMIAIIISVVALILVIGIVLGIVLKKDGKSLIDSNTSSNLSQTVDNKDDTTDEGDKEENSSSSKDEHKDTTVSQNKNDYEDISSGNENTSSNNSSSAGSTTSKDEEKQEDEEVAPPIDLPPTVEIPTEKDPETGKEEIKFPCKLEGYDLVIEKLAPYDGIYVEDGTNSNVKDVAMLLVRNDGDFPIEYTQISVEYEGKSLLFDVSALPVGESAVVQEKNGNSTPDGSPIGGEALVVQRANMEMSKDKIAVKDNGDNSITVTNLTDEMIPTVRVFYKYYMEDKDVFVGGIAFTVKVRRLGANSSIVVRPSHYTSQSGRIVMILTYDE